MGDDVNDDNDDDDDDDDLLLLWRFAPYHFFNVQFMWSNPYVAN